MTKEIEANLEKTLIDVYETGLLHGEAQANGVLPSAKSREDTILIGINEVESVFKYAGYHKDIKEPQSPDPSPSQGLLKASNQEMPHLNCLVCSSLRNERNGYLSGQEWYNRFYKEMHDGEDHVDDTKSYYIGYVLEAAKKAAGIEEKE